MLTRDLSPLTSLDGGRVGSLHRWYPQASCRVVADVWKKDVWDSGQIWELRFLPSFLDFPKKIAVQKMSGKMPGSPRHPSTRHPSTRHPLLSPWPRSMSFSLSLSLSLSLCGSFLAKTCVGNASAPVVHTKECLRRIASMWPMPYGLECPRRASQIDLRIDASSRALTHRCQTPGQPSGTSKDGKFVSQAQKARVSEKVSHGCP